MNTPDRNDGQPLPVGTGEADLHRLPDSAVISSVCDARRTVLVIDSDTISLHLTKEILQYDMHTVYTAVSWHEGMELLSHHPDSITVLLCAAANIAEGEADWFRQMKNRNPAVTCILAASAAELKRLNGLAGLDFVEILVKPYGAKMLLNFIRNSRR